MKHITLAALLTLSACAPIQTEPIRVEDVRVLHEINVGGLIEFFAAHCRTMHPTYNDAQVEACADAAMGEFLLTFLGGN